MNRKQQYDSTHRFATYNIFHVLSRQKKENFKFPTGFTLATNWVSWKHKKKIMRFLPKNNRIKKGPKPNSAPQEILSRLDKTNGSKVPYFAQTILTSRDRFFQYKLIFEGVFHDKQNPKNKKSKKQFTKQPRTIGLFFNNTRVCSQPHEPMPCL